MYLIRRIKLCLEQHGSLSSVISVKSASQRIENSGGESAVF